MKTTNGFVSSVFCALFFLSFNIASADQCTAPTPPVRFTTVPVYTTMGLQPDGATVLDDGQVLTTSGNIIPAPKKQVQVDTTNDPMYKADLISYGVCSQINTMKASGESLDAYKSSDLHQQANAPTPNYHPACPYPIQSASQVSQIVVDTVSNGVTTIKKYSDGTYALFNVLGMYNWPASESYYNDMVQWQKDLTSIDQIANGTYSAQTAWNGTSLMLGVEMDMDVRKISLNARKSAIDKWLSDKANCPTTTPQDVYNSLTGNRPQAVAVPTVTNVTNVSSSSPTITANPFSRTLKIGMSGDDVKLLQNLLQIFKYISPTQKLSVYFGGVTKSAVMKFQRDNNIQPASGLFGPASQAKLMLLVNKN